MDQNLLQFINYFSVPIRVVEVDSRKCPCYSLFNDAALLEDDLCQEDISGRTAIDVYPGVIGEVAHDRHLKVVETGQPLTFDVDEVVSDGTRIWYRITLAPITNEQDAIVRIFCTQVDVTAERRMQSVESDAGLRVREMEKYVAMAAHDLRTPMVNVRLIADHLKEDFQDLGDGKLQMIEKLVTISETTMSLVSDVLAHAQTTADRESKTEIFQLDEICADLVSVLDPLGRSELVCTHSSMAADKVVVQIAAGNLIDNALKHNGGEGLKLSVSVSQKSENYIEVCVADNGKGFADPAISFVDTGVMTSSSGFGLIGVRRLVRERGGDIRACSNSENGGAAIYFSLPGTLLSVDPDLDLDEVG